MRVGLLAGSLNEGSTNELALGIVAERARGSGEVVATIDGLAEVPAFVPSRTDDAPDSVVGFRRQLAAADAVVIAAPEYAAGVAGSVKNALDWLVGAATLYRKVIGVMSVGTTGGVKAIEQLVCLVRCC